MKNRGSWCGFVLSNVGVLHSPWTGIGIIGAAIDHIGDEGELNECPVWFCSESGVESDGRSVGLHSGDNGGEKLLCHCVWGGSLVNSSLSSQKELDVCGLDHDVVDASLWSTHLVETGTIFEWNPHSGLQMMSRIM